MNGSGDSAIELEPEGCSDWIWRHKYALDPSETSIERGWRRVAAAAASGEREPARWSDAFRHLLSGYTFLPGGRILAGAGHDTAGTLCSCFVMGLIDDSFSGLMQAIEQAALTMQAGGGTGIDFSSLRPQGEPGYGGDSVAPGPVAAARIFDAVCRASVTRSGRSGAMMATLRCDHPDIETFIHAKSEPGELTHANLSVLITDEFMQAVRSDADWPLVFPGSALDHGHPSLNRIWSDGQPRQCRIYRSVGARRLWTAIKHAAFDYAEPGVLFIDRINACNNLVGRESLLTTNPCAEQPLPAYGACTLGSVNLTRLVRQPFTSQAQLDWDALATSAGLAVRLLDNIVDMARYPLAQQTKTAMQTRRIGLGFTGLGDALAMLNLSYASVAGTETAARIMAAISAAAYRASAQLAAEKGPFPLFERNAFAATQRATLLPKSTLALIDRHGLRNSHLTAIAPAGTISLLAGNVSGGIEPMFSARVERSVHEREGQMARIAAESYACHLWRALHPESALPEQFVFANDIAPQQHLAMLAAVQPYVDAGIAKTINLPADCNFTAAEQIFDSAYKLDLKGCTVFRSGARAPQLRCRA